MFYLHAAANCFDFELCSSNVLMSRNMVGNYEQVRQTMDFGRLLFSALLCSCCRFSFVNFEAILLANGRFATFGVLLFFGHWCENRFSRPEVPIVRGVTLSVRTLIVRGAKCADIQLPPYVKKAKFEASCPTLLCPFTRSMQVVRLRHTIPCALVLSRRGVRKLRRKIMWCNEISQWMAPFMFGRVVRHFSFRWHSLRSMEAIKRFETLSNPLRHSPTDLFKPLQTVRLKILC